MLPTATPRRGAGRDVDVVEADRVVGDDLELRPGRVEELVVDPVGEQASGRRRSRRSGAGARPAAAAARPPRRRRRRRPAIGRQPLVGDPPRDEDARPVGRAAQHPAPPRSALDERPDPAQRLGQVRLRVRVRDPDVVVADARRTRSRRGRRRRPRGAAARPARRRSARSRRCPGRRRTRRSAGGTRMPGIALSPSTMRSRRALNSTTIASTASCGPTSASTAPTWANVGAPLIVLMISWP